MSHARRPPRAGFGWWLSSATGEVVNLAERWDGTSWRRQPTPTPAQATNAGLAAVACTSSSACTGVGAVGIQLAFAERWNGSRWRIEPTPNPMGPAPTSELLGIACTSPSACTAVGDETDNRDVELNLAERWDGRRWSLEAIPSPAGSPGSGLRSVACPSASVCIAVGAYANVAGGTLTLAERWDGTTWRIESTQAAAGAQFASLNAVACPTATSCVAVGTYTDSVGVSRSLAERWDGTTWHLLSAPDPAAGGGLNGVTAPPGAGNASDTPAVR